MTTPVLTDAIERLLKAASELAETALDASKALDAVKSTPYLIWSNEHSRWWGPDEAGYVMEVRHAGRYTRERALAIVQRAQLGRGSKDEPPEIAIAEADAKASVEW